MKVKEGTRRIRKPIDVEEAKKLILDMLTYLDQFCRENGIEYFLYFGTLLGAVRHKGFIPWDDDADICMKRKEYEKFVKLFNRSSSRYKLMTWRDKAHYVTYAKIVDSETVCIEEYQTCEIGIFVDLFILDNEGDSLMEAKRFLRLLSPFVRLSRCVTHYNKLVMRLRRREHPSKWRIMLAGIFHRILPKRGYLHFIDLLSKAKQKRGITKYIGSVNASKYNERQILESVWFDSAVRLEFEGVQLSAPVGYKEVLTTIYHNYMELPPVEMRYVHKAERFLLIKE